jgi:plastocyanin
MVNILTIFVALLIVSGISLTLSVRSVSAQTEGEQNATTTSSNGTIPDPKNNTLTLNVTEVGKEQYRWTDSSGVENPTIKLVANNEYTVKITNPTDEKHELIIDSNADGKTSEIAKSGEIEPGKDIEFKFKTEDAGALGYHCEYHPDMMKGNITVFASP